VLDLWWAVFCLECLSLARIPSCNRGSHTVICLKDQIVCVYFVFNSDLLRQSLRLYVIWIPWMCPYEWCKHKHNLEGMGQYLLGKRNTTCLNEKYIHCFLCHPEEENRPLVGEGWVAAGPLRGLFLQGHTHAWSEAVAHGDWICAGSLLWLHTAHPVGPSPCDWGRLIKLARFEEERNLSKLEVTRFPPAKENRPFFKWISLKSKSDNEWELAVKTPLCTLYTKAPTFPHTCFDMQIALKEIWKHSCPLLTNR